MREQEKKNVGPCFVGQEFQLTLTGVNQTPNVHLGLGLIGVEIQRRNSSR